MWKKLTKSEVLNKFYCVHSDDYDYSLMDYKGTKVKINIICPIHGLFSQTPANHFIGRGCPKCSGNDKKTTNDFKDKLIKIYGNTLDYSLLNYVNIQTKVKLICKEHGEFEIFPKHLIYDNHQGCYKCENKRVFIEKAKEVHEDKYNYDLVKYDNAHDNVLIVCKKHGAFEQLAYQHINGSGCPRCSESKGEKQIRNYLIKNNIDYENQKKFEDCKYISTLKYDFYLPKYNLCIEYDGQQHFILKNYWGGEKEFEKIQKRDKIKTQYCRDNNINLLRIKYTDNILEKLNDIKNKLFF